MEPNWVTRLPGLTLLKLLQVFPSQSNETNCNQQQLLQEQEHKEREED